MFTWNKRIDMGEPLSKILPLVGPWALREITSNNARFPDPKVKQNIEWKQINFRCSEFVLKLLVGIFRTLLDWTNQ